MSLKFYNFIVKLITEHNRIYSCMYEVIFKLNTKIKYFIQPRLSR